MCYFYRIKTKIPVHGISFFSQALEHATVDEDSPFGGLEKVHGSGHGAGGAEELDPHVTP